MPKKCKTENCSKQSYWGYSKDMKGISCKIHATPEMIDVYHPKCIKCKVKRPSFGVNKNKPTHCKDCKTNEMNDVINKKCKCGLYKPSFGLIIDKNPVCCSICKTNEMVDVVQKLCICNSSRPLFGLENDEKPICCSKCRTPEMKDIVDKMCVICNEVRPSFGIDVKKKPTHCKKCKTDDMNSCNYKCILCNKIQASYSLIKNKKPTHCSNCKTIDMVSNGKMCKSELCDTLISKKQYEGYCAYCFANLFPEKEVVRNFRTKERKVVDFIKESFKDYKWVFDKQIQGGNSQRRPDIFLNLGHQIIIIEIDENQHRKYDCSCDNKRLMELSQDVGFMSIIFIRFNPDTYIDKNNKKIPSCFTVTKKTGVLQINSQTKWLKRLNILKETIQYWIEDKTDKTIEIIELFYNQN